MSAYRANRPRRDILEEIRQQGKFCEYLFVSWGIIEREANQSILKAYGLSRLNPRAQPLLDLSVRKQLELFKETGFLSTEGYNTVLKFSEMVSRFSIYFVMRSFSNSFRSIKH